MKDSDELWLEVDTIPGSFTYINTCRLYEYALQAKNLVVEIGVDQGRSASVLLNAARETGATVILVDSGEGWNNHDKAQQLIDRFPDVHVRYLRVRSVDAALLIEGPIDLVHIDADHYGSSPSLDCMSWLPKLKRGGIACFHDYEATFPAVTEAVNLYTQGWENLGKWDGLAIRRKP